MKEDSDDADGVACRGMWNMAKSCVTKSSQTGTVQRLKHRLAKRLLERFDALKRDSGNRPQPAGPYGVISYKRARQRPLGNTRGMGKFTAG